MVDTTTPAASAGGATPDIEQMFDALVAGETLPPDTTPPSGDKAPPVDDKGAAPNAPSGQDAGSGEGADDDDDEGEGAPEGGDEGEGAPAGDAPPTKETPAEPPEIDYKQRYLELLEQRQGQGATPPAAPEPAPAAKEEPLPPFEITAEQKEVIKQFEEEWPEQAAGVRAMAAEMEASLKNLMRGAFGEMLQLMQQQIEPVQQSAQQSAVERYRARLAEAHPDYETLRPALVEWVKTLPEATKRAYVEIAQRGSADDMVMLLNTYKAINNVQAPQAQPGTNGQGQDEADARRRRAAGSLAPVKQRRGATPIAAPDKEDFDSAWQEAVAQ